MVHRKRPAGEGAGLGMGRAMLLLAGYFAGTSAALAQDGPEAPQAAPTADEAASEKPIAKFFDRFVDEEDGKVDFSNVLAKGGFIPMPVIITEPAVDGGFGVAAQFITVPRDNPRRVTRRILGGALTGNGSYGYGYFQSGQAFDGRVSYKFGLAQGKITLDAHPRFLQAPLEYTNKYKYGVLASALIHFADDRFSVGPMIDFRRLESSIEFQNPPIELDRDFNRKLQTGALGFGMHFDGRDNAVTPTRGMNVFVEGKFNADAFGSDRTFQTYKAGFYSFHPLTSDWRLGYKLEVDAARDNFPIYFAPAINLRGVEMQRYQGSTVFSSEVEVTRQLNDRWAILAFAGYGSADAGDRRLFRDSGAIFAGGGGFRYRLARKLGLDAGLDVAYGPGGGVFYIQFGHAWGTGMD